MKVCWIWRASWILGLKALPDHHLLLEEVILDGERSLLGYPINDLHPAGTESQSARSLLDQHGAVHNILDGERHHGKQRCVTRQDSRQFLIRVRREMKPCIRGRTSSSSVRTTGRLFSQAESRRRNSPARGSAERAAHRSHQTHILQWV